MATPKTFKVGSAPWEQGDAQPNTFKVGSAPWETSAPAPAAPEKQLSKDEQIDQNIRAKNESGDASNDALFDMLTAGHLPQIKAKVKQLLSGDGIANDENYLKRRDLEIADMKARAEKYPGPHREGSVVGLLAPMLLTGGGSAAAEAAPAVAGQVARQGLLKAAAKGVATGAVMGAAQNPGDKEGVADPIQLQERAANAKTGALIGGAVGGAASKIPDAAEGLNKLAETKAFKAGGAMLKDFRKAFSRGEVESSGRFMLDSGLVKAGDTVEDVAQKARSMRDSVGKELGKGYDAAAQILPKLGQEASAKVAAAGFNPVRDRAAILATAKEELGHAFNGKQALDRLGSYLDELAEKHGDQTLAPQVTNEIKTAIDKTAIHWERNPLAREPDTETAIKAFRRALSDKVSTQIQAIGEVIGNPEAAKNLADLNAKYGAASRIARMASDKVNRENANQMFSLTDKIAAGAGGIAGASAGGPAGLATAAATAVGSKLARKYGNGVVAAGANAAGKALARVQPSELQLANPGIYKSIAGAAEAQTAVQPALKLRSTSELDRDSSSSAQEAPVRRGPEKWAADGFENLQSHGGADGLDRAALMNDPKAKELLIKASDLKPGSKAMDKILTQLKERAAKGSQDGRNTSSP